MSEWSVVTNTKKIKYLAKKEAQREVEQASFQRAEREKANARSFSSSVFDVEVEKKPSTSKKNKYSYSNLSFDLEETQKKKSKKPKKKTSSVQISNSNQLADVLLDILKNHNQDSMSLGKLSDKLQKLTGSTWKAKFKKRYGTILAFTKSREEFRVKDNEDVYMAEDADFSSDDESESSGSSRSSGSRQGGKSSKSSKGSKGSKGKSVTYGGVETYQEQPSCLSRECNSWTLFLLPLFFLVMAAFAIEVTGNTEQVLRELQGHARDVLLSLKKIKEESA